MDPVIPQKLQTADDYADRTTRAVKSVLVEIGRGGKPGQGNRLATDRGMGWSRPGGRGVAVQGPSRQVQDTGTRVRAFDTVEVSMPTDSLLHAHNNAHRRGWLEAHFFERPRTKKI